MKTFFKELNATLSNALTPVVKWIIYLCTGMFLFTLILGTVSPGVAAYIVRLLGASLSETLFKVKIWQLITYGFVHADFMHLLFNMLPLYFFGQRLEYRWGSLAFGRFCFIMVIGAVLTHLTVSAGMMAFSNAGPSPVIIGASGVIYGLMIACALYYPDDIVYFQFLIPIKLKYLVAIMALFTFLGSAQSSGSGIAHLTHLGGLLFGFLYVKFPVLFDWIPTPRLPRKKKPEFVDPRERWRNMK